MAKLKIDLLQKMIEIEGEENFIRDVYAKSHQLLYQNPTAVDQSLISKQLKRKKLLKESYSLVKNMNLNQPVSLKEFAKSKKTASALEKNALFIYYLEKIAGFNRIDLNRIYTCYKETGEKMPKALKQSLADTSSKKGWIDTKKMNDIRITVLGENYIENLLA